MVSDLSLPAVEFTHEADSSLVWVSYDWATSVTLQERKVYTRNWVLKSLNHVVAARTMYIDTTYLTFFGNRPRVRNTDNIRKTSSPENLQKKIHNVWMKHYVWMWNITNSKKKNAYVFSLPWEGVSVASLFAQPTVEVDNGLDVILQPQEKTNESGLPCAYLHNNVSKKIWKITWK